MHSIPTGCKCAEDARRGSRSTLCAVQRSNDFSTKCGDRYDNVASGIRGNPVGDVIDADLAIVDLTMLGPAVIYGKHLISLTRRTNHVVDNHWRSPNSNPLRRRASI